eukprot:jgi/Mesvir1/17987/Mv09331-RA.1
MHFKRFFAGLVCILAFQCGNAQLFGSPYDGFKVGAALTGLKEVPPVLHNAGGVAMFHAIDDGEALFVELWLFNIFRVTQAHIHCGQPGTNGPVLVWVWPSVDATGPASSGDALDVPYLAKVGKGDLDEEGEDDEDFTIREEHILSVQASPACPNPPTSMEQLMDLMQAGGTYLNVHTLTFPGGSVRGNIQPITPGDDDDSEVDDVETDNSNL